ncbi:hypothetical protein MS3_00004327 [Schistosoma haematobium]|uniref:Lipopolysaccharide-induced tumor necrosis factor-alpha factor-like protein n=1 Tax=Schistosoma haematobium TaxID=6185 RepID=A0A094ZWI1_SCHHA|nr:hypothetical protein MS3_00004327 [Schistosoma haematobium]KAH9592379.1 hypothetical protein MS3_00004327 [Schistosoma haematobium]
MLQKSIAELNVPKNLLSFNQIAVCIYYLINECSDFIRKLMTKTSIVQQPVGLVPTTYYGPQPVSSSCDICMNKITTTVQYRKGVCTWMACTGITLIGGIFGCCLIPFYVNSCKDAYHSCPECGTLLGVYKRI